LIGAAVTPRFFESTGFAPVVGRRFVAEEYRGATAQVVILHHEIWKAKYGGRASVVGDTLQIDGVRFTIVGVAPLGFNLPPSAHYWIPKRTNEGRP
jgi:hypothetical protein